jgi:hypothetical protein
LQQAQNAPDQQQQFYGALRKLATIDPQKYGEAAMNTSPLAQMGAMADVQLKRAQAENTKAEAQTRGVLPLPNGQYLHIKPTGDTEILGEAIPLSDEGKKLHDLLNLHGKMGDKLAPDVQQGVTQPTQGDQIQNQINYALMPPDQQKAADERAKAIQEADQQIVDAKTARDQMLPSLNQMDVLNSSGKLPSTFPEEQAAGSKLLQGFGMGNGEADTYVNTFKQLNSGNFTKGLSSFLASGGGNRMELPITEALKVSNAIPLNSSDPARQKMINQLRISAHNSVIAAQNKAARLRDPNAPIIPELPMNTSKKIFTMQEVVDKAKARGVPPEAIIKKIQETGNLVAQ